MIKAFLDTNVLFSAIIFGSGPPRELLRQAAAGAYLPCVSEGVLRELEEVLARSRARKLLREAYSRQELIRILHDLTEGMYVSFGSVQETEQVPRDPKDDHILSAAVQMQVDYLVSGDKKHILPLRDNPRLRTLGIQVVSPRELADLLKARGGTHK
jgi:putative PIN family toxin of toxin-antitoxin system